MLTTADANRTPYEKIERILRAAGATDFQRHPSGGHCQYKGRKIGVSIFLARGSTTVGSLYVFVHTTDYTQVQWHGDNPFRRLKQILEIL